MVRYLIRELAGWALIALGLYVFYQVYLFCDPPPPPLLPGQDPKQPQPKPAPHTLEAFCLTIVGVFIFRGGIHLLKMAVAARICREAQERLYPVSGAEAQYNRGRENPRKPEFYKAGSSLTKRA